MKLSKEIKEKIDIYFDNISASELFEIATKKYGFSESHIELENQSFSTIKKLSSAGFKEGKEKIKRTTEKQTKKCQNVIDKNTGIIYNTIIEASNAADITLRHFKRCLYGDRPNYTSFELVNKKQEYKCKKK